MHLCVHHSVQVQNISFALWKFPCVPFQVLHHPPKSQDNHCPDVYRYRLIFQVLELHINGILIYILFCVCCLLLSVMILMPISVVPAVHLSTIPLYENIIYLFSYWWTFGLLLLFGYYDWSHWRFLCSSFVDICYFFWVNIKEWDCWVIVWMYV